MSDNQQISMKVLLADADEVSRAAIMSVLISIGHRVYEASNAVEAIDQFVEASPDIMLIDELLACDGSVNAVETIKNRLGTRFIPIIFLTKNQADDTIGKCIVGGGDGFLVRPVNPVLLNFKLQSFQRILGMCQKLDDYQRQTEEELETSKHIFKSLIDNGNHAVSGLSIWGESAGHFSGDTRLFNTLADGRVYVLLCDFTGHGLPAAIGTVFVADLFRSMTNKGLASIDILNEINDKMHQILPTGRYCAAIMLDYDPEQKMLKVWNCGLPNAYIVDEYNEILQTLPSVSVPLGVLKGDAQCEPAMMSVKAASSIIVLSDGITEAENPEGVMYSEQRLLACIGNTKKETEIGKEIQNNVEDFMDGAQPTDDISLVVLNFNSKPELLTENKVIEL